MLRENAILNHERSNATGDDDGVTATIDKYIAYTTVPSLLYCLIVDPETAYLILHAAVADEAWEATPCKRANDAISFPVLDPRR